MRGWTVRQFGHYKRELVWEDQPELKAEGASALIEVRAAGVMFADLLNISGIYQFKAPLPFVPGSEAAGVVMTRRTSSASAGSTISGGSMAASSPAAVMRLWGSAGASGGRDRGIGTS